MLPTLGRLQHQHSAVGLEQESVSFRDERIDKVYNKEVIGAW